VQAAFLDTPGLHRGESALHKRLVETARSALYDVDVLLFVAEVTRQGMEAAKKAAGLARAAAKPAVLALNKIDLLPDKKALFKLLEEAALWGDWQALVPISALKGEGLDLVIKELSKLLPPGGPLFPPDTLTDLSLRFLAGEIIREKVFQLTGQEVPYAAAVTVEEFAEPAENRKATVISATIHLERPGQKAIVIGKKGAKLKEIGITARKDIEELLGGPVFLSLFVRVEPKWSRQAKGLRKMGY
jgi:GTP-binding protein Era